MAVEVSSSGRWAVESLISPKVCRCLAASATASAPVGGEARQFLDGGDAGGFGDDRFDLAERILEPAPLVGAEGCLGLLDEPLSVRWRWRCRRRCGFRWRPRVGGSGRLESAARGLGSSRDRWGLGLAWFGGRVGFGAGVHARAGAGAGAAALRGRRCFGAGRRPTRFRPSSLRLQSDLPAVRRRVLRVGFLSPGAGGAFRVGVVTLGG